MIKLWAFGIFCAVAIGAIIGLITTIWIGKKRLPHIVGVILAFVFCLAYHAIAAIGVDNPVLHLLTRTIIVPFAYGFGDGNRAFWVALFIQATVSGFIGMVTYLLMTKGK